MRVTVFTEESGIKLPEIKKWKNSLGRGRDIGKDKEIKALLEENNLSLPQHNIELEKRYREILQDYLRPARTMFAGMFTEVRDFKDNLSNYNISLYIISGRYGLLGEDEIIIPYVSNISSTNDIEILDKRTDFSQRILEKTTESNIVIILLPIQFISYLLTIDWFSLLNSNSTIVLVTSKHFKEKFSDMPNIKLLERKGVARMGSYNREEIISIIESVNE
ncbi:hypothetical protein [Methanomethylovorans sp.]|uniref:hypothetical protein n=1 Tax=Methanomethylovorans sp. TaxID=2758717 RepID=UPI003D0BD3A5